jgi:uncharacterized protein (TIGR00661 family)
MMRRGVVYGVCGIGNGHAYRAIPVIRALARERSVAVLTYGGAAAVFGKESESLPNLRVFPVSVPYLPGGPRGLDWAAAASRAGAVDPWAVNGRTLAAVEELIEKPAMVISDYEPVSASYAYATGAPLVTFDQQSKFLVGDFPRSGQDGEFGPDDEIARLRMFFPKADLRLACSFFPVPLLSMPYEAVEIVAPVLRAEILHLRREPADRPTVLVYLSPEAVGGGDPVSIAAAAADYPQTEFHIYCKPQTVAYDPVPANVTLHNRGDGAFMDLLAKAHGIICTAGHGLLSEIAHLGIPALTVPLQLHEQQTNAAAMESAGSGIKAEGFTAAAVGSFLRALPELKAVAAAADGRLIRGTSAAPIVKRLRRWLDA